MLTAIPNFKNKRPPMPMNMLIRKFVEHNKKESRKISLSILVDSIDELKAIQNYLFNNYEEIYWAFSGKKCLFTSSMCDVFSNNEGPLLLTLNYNLYYSSKLTYSSSPYPKNLNEIGTITDDLTDMFINTVSHNYYILFSDYFKVTEVSDDYYTKNQ